MSSKALLILDMLNTLEFPEASSLLPFAERAGNNILKLKRRCRRKNIPIIYLNDNFGIWDSDWKTLYSKCIDEKCLGRGIAKKLKPEKGDYFIFKPKHSGFFCTNLEVLLDHLKVKSLIITGIAGNICVLFTANDAHMREFKVIVPNDCIASNTQKDNDYALNFFKGVFGFSIGQGKGLRL